MTITIVDRTPRRTVLANVGLWLRDHQNAIRSLQWSIIAVYAVLLITPTLLPLPGRLDHIWNNLTIFAQFVFWGIWWPGVLLSIILFGRLWCGILCPEGSLSERASRHGLGRATPRWMLWRGWPFTAFVMTTVYGQMVSVYQYPAPAALVLGGSTLAAIAVGFVYGREKRVWCRYLCPVNGVFGLLAKLAPMHYVTDQAAWAGSSKRDALDNRFVCAPLVPIKTLDGASACHMCGRCAGFRDAIELKPRAPGSEIVRLSKREATAWESALIIIGLMGVAVGAFQWSMSPWFIAAKQAVATCLVDQDLIWPLTLRLPWWILTDYPGRNDVMTVLDGALLLAYIAMAAVAMSLALALPVAAATRILGEWRWLRFHHLVQSLIPLAAVGVILGLSAQTVTLLHADGFDLRWVDNARVGALSVAVLASMVLCWMITASYADLPRRIAATLAFAPACAASVWSWALIFWIW